MTSSVPVSAVSRPARRALVLIAVLLLAGAVGCTRAPDRETRQGSALSASTTTTGPARAVTGVLLGASSSPEERGLAAEKATVEALEDAIGRRLDINHNFYGWNDPFPSEVERWDLQLGRIPMISWNGKGVTTSTIAAGGYDDLIQHRARATRALGRPVLIRWFWEMDGNKKAEFAGSPEQYVAAWQRIVGIFRAEGVDNVGWVWCPNASAFNDGQAQTFYPGDDFVDWTCADGYNWAPGGGDDYRSFEEIFGGFYAWASRRDKPIMVGEFGVQERNPGDKAQWIKATGETIKADFPLLRAIVYFHANKDYDWRLTTSESALDAFRQLANDPWFNLGDNRRFLDGLGGWLGPMGGEPQPG